MNRFWKSCLWQFNRNKLFLIPGNSPIGLRLPLDRLPQMAPELEEIVLEASPLETPEPLAELERLSTPTQNIPEHAKQVATLKTALCIEPRDGKLYLFMPPHKQMGLIFN